MTVAREADASALAALRVRAADALTRDFGEGHWSTHATERGVLQAIRSSRVLAAWDADLLLGTLRLATRKPWAIDVAWFTPVDRPLYLTDMAVDPEVQRRGIGRWLLAEADAFARAWPSDAIRLDAYDAAAGAGGFYARCGYAERGRVAYRGNPLVYFERVL